MQAKVLAMVLDVLLRILTPNLLKKFADMVLDFAEDFVIGTKSKVDDALVLPLCNLVRATFGVANDDPALGAVVEGSKANLTTGGKP